MATCIPALWASLAGTGMHQIIQAMQMPAHQPTVQHAQTEALVTERQCRGEGEGARAATPFSSMCCPSLYKVRDCYRQDRMDGNKHDQGCMQMCGKHVGLERTRWGRGSGAFAAAAPCRRRPDIGQAWSLGWAGHSYRGCGRGTQCG